MFNMGKNKRKTLCFILAFSMVYAQDKTKEEEPISETEAFLQEMQANSTTEETSYNSNLSPQQRFEENPKYNVHEYNYKQQVIVGGTIMFCIALSLIMNNNYNPKRGK
jgi:mannitol-1-phosphate/altronate dehydrogenase